MDDDRAADDPLAPFRWHPEPELIGIRDADASREALERAGKATWDASLDWLYDEAMVRAMGQPTDYAELRRVYFGDRAAPGAAPQDPAPLQAVLDEFARADRAPHAEQLPPAGPSATSRPPPLVASIVGEVLAQWTNQGVDVWHAGPVAAFVEEEVVRWLCDLVGYGEGSFGLLASGGVMANFIAMALVRDVHLRALTGASKPPRGRRARGRPRLRERPDPLLDRAGARRARLPARDAGLGPERRPVPPPRGAGRRGHREGPRRRPAARRHRRRRRLDQHGIGRPRPRARGPGANERACGSTSTRRTAARPGCRRGTRTASRASTSRTA